MLSTEYSKEIEESVWNFLLDNNRVETASKLIEESEFFSGQLPQRSNERLLERKWFTIIKLQSKIVELERKLNYFEEQLSKGIRKVQADKDTKEKIIRPTLKLAYVHKGSKDTITSVSIHKSESVFASGCIDGSARIFDYEMNEHLCLLRSHTHSINCIKWREDELFTGSSDMTIKLWKSSKSNQSNSFSDFVCFKTFVGHDHSISDLCDIVNSELLVSVSRDRCIKIWNVNSGFCQKSINNSHEDWIRCCDANQSHFATSGNDRTVKILDIESQIKKGEGSVNGEQIKWINSFIAHENSIDVIKMFSLETDKNNTRLLTGSRDKNIGLWNYSSGTIIFKFTGHENWVKGLSIFGQSNFFLSVGEDKTIRVWDVARRKVVHIEKSAHDHFVSCIDIHSEYQIAVTGSVDKNVKIWKIFNAEIKEGFQYE